MWEGRSDEEIEAARDGYSSFLKRVVSLAEGADKTAMDPHKFDFSFEREGVEAQYSADLKLYFPDESGRPRLYILDIGFGQADIVQLAIAVNWNESGPVFKIGRNPNPLSIVESERLIFSPKFGAQLKSGLEMHYTTTHSSPVVFSPQEATRPN